MEHVTVVNIAQVRLLDSLDVTSATLSSARRRGATSLCWVLQHSAPGLQLGGDAFVNMLLGKNNPGGSGRRAGAR